MYKRQEVINPEPEINAVVFRFKDDHQTDGVNKIIHRTLFKLSLIHI
ncbi:hypothetical protein H8944_18640 [Bacillus pumilus]|nr:hypothetical protein [Bacillus pumilus]